MRQGIHTQIICITFIVGLVMVLLAIVTSAENAQIELIYTMWAGAGQLPTMEAVLADFEDEHPNVKVKVILPSGDYHEKLTVMFAGGSPPDVFWINEPFVRFHKAGWLMDLTSFIESDPDVSLDNYFELATRFYVVDGRTWALPKDLNCDVIYYNRSMFAESGLVASPRWDWAQFQHVLRKLNRYDAEGKLQQASMSWPTGKVFAFIWQNGGDIYEPAFNKIVINSANAIEAIDFLMNLRDQHLVPSSAEMGSFPGFANPNVGMYIAARWGRIHYGRTDIDWDVLPLPRQKTRGTNLWVGAAAISPTTKHPEAAWELLKWITGSPGQVRYWGELGESIPSLRSAAVETTLVPPPQGAQFYIEPLEEDYAHIVCPWWTDNWGEINSIINAQLGRVWSGEIPADSAVKNIVDTATPLLADAVFLKR